jgi:hypothetical protein
MRADVTRRDSDRAGGETTGEVAAVRAVRLRAAVVPVVLEGAFF